ncbi:MAG: hypothetical protein AAFQ82_27190 [Myxococcota bacterium]
MNDSLFDASQFDRDPLTRHDSYRCVPQGLTAVAILSGPAATQSLLNGLRVPAANTHHAQAYRELGDDYADGVLSEQSLGRVADMLYAQHSAGGRSGTTRDEFMTLVTAIDATVTRPWQENRVYRPELLSALQPGEYAVMLVKRLGTDHAVIAGRQPGANSWLYFDPARNRPLQVGLSEEQLLRRFSGAGVLATLRF